MFYLKALIIATSVLIQSLTLLAAESTTQSTKNVMAHSNGTPYTSVKVNDGQTTVTLYRRGMVGFERRVKVFIENVRRGYLPMPEDESVFLRELQGYIDKLPNKTSQAPERICYNRYNDRRPCRDEDIIPEEPCEEFFVDKTSLVQSFTRFYSLLLEPVKIKLRNLEFQLTSLKESVIAIELLTNLTDLMCGMENNDCINETTELLNNKLSYKQRRKNMTQDLINTQEEAEIAHKNIQVLKEQLFAQLSHSIERYTCCLKSFNFTVEGHDCDPKPVVIVTTTETTLRGNNRGRVPPLVYAARKERCAEPWFFRCGNGECIESIARCDKLNDCGDYSDEYNCEEEDEFW